MPDDVHVDGRRERERVSGAGHAGRQSERRAGGVSAEIPVDLPVSTPIRRIAISLRAREGDRNHLARRVG